MTAHRGLLSSYRQETSRGLVAQPTRTGEMIGRAALVPK